MHLIDTHCHIHEADYPLDKGDVLNHARAAGVSTMICIGTNERSSFEAVEFAKAHEGVYAAIGVHPHDTKDGYAKIAELTDEKIVAVGEIGLDYYYNHSPRDVQIAALESQIQTALDRDLPVVFHVRDASSAERYGSVWDDFWPILDNFHGIRGELHSFTDTQANLDKGFERGLYVGVNGISTFTKDAVQQQLFASIPLARLLLETDAPFLTPTPYRGTINEPAYVSEVAKHHALLRGITLETVAEATTHNANSLFRLA